MLSLLRNLIVFLAALGAIVAVVTAQDPDTQLIREVCNHASNSDFCFSVLSSDPRSRGKRFADLTYLSIVISNEKVKQGRIRVSEAEKGSTNPLVKKILYHCGAQYDIGPVRGTASALVDFNGFRYGLAAASIVKCVESIEDCNESFRTAPGGPVNVIGDANALVMKHCFLALNLVNSIGNGSV